jgi:hypothetical protein
MAGRPQNLLYRHRPVTQLGCGHRQERRQPPRLEVHADEPGPEWVAELPRAGGHGDHAAVGVLGRLDVGAGADAERRPRLTMSNANGTGGSVSWAYGGAPSR